MNFYQTFVGLCKQINKSPSTVAEEIGLSRAAVTRWKQGTTPGSSILSKISKYFGVSMDAFDTGVTEEEKEMAELLQRCKDDPDLRALFLLTSKATPEDIRKTIAIIKAIKGEQNG